VLLVSRDYVKIGEAAKILGVTEQTLRNWDSRGKLVPFRHPVNGYRMYRVADVHAILKELEPTQTNLQFDALVRATPSTLKAVEEPLLPCHWIPEVALDPKHRPQHWDAPATTVRRDWRKYPQEAHVIDSAGHKYRRFTVDEIAILQGFEPRITDVNAGGKMHRFSGTKIHQ
jgi:MerR family regulatory protein